jgi:hypothetical protein
MRLIAALVLISRLWFPSHALAAKHKRMRSGAHSVGSRKDDLKPHFAFSLAKGDS